MARIKIEDIPRDRELSDSELDRVVGGTTFATTSFVLSPTQLYGSFSLYRLPLVGVTVTGVRG